MFLENSQTCQGVKAQSQIILFLKILSTASKEEPIILQTSALPKKSSSLHNRAKGITQSTLKKLFLAYLYSYLNIKLAEK